MSKKINRNEFESEVLTSKEIVLVDFYADWCGPCKMLGPVMDSIEEAKVYKINVDEEGELASSFGIMSIPCVIAFKDGKEKARSIGLVSKDQILDLLK